jgi:hypothetical protein
MLSLLPRSPRAVDTATLEQRLREQGVRVNRRSIQRDLVALSGLFPIVCDERSKPYGWAWAEDGPALQVPGSGGSQGALGSRLARAITQAAGAIRGGVIDAIIDALVQGRCCIIVRKDIRRSTQAIEPIALVFRERTPWLVFLHDERVRQVSLRAISSAKLGGEGDGMAKELLVALARLEAASRRSKPNGGRARARGRGARA